MIDKNETAVHLPKCDVVNATADIWAYSAEAMTRYGDEREAEARATQLEMVRRLVGRIDMYRLCMSYNESYFGEPAGLVKGVFSELAHLINPIYPSGKTAMADPLAGVTVYTETGTHTAPFDAWWEKTDGK